MHESFLYVNFAITAGAGFIPWLIATGRFPADQDRRRALESRLPLVRNTRLLKGIAVALWLVAGINLFAGLLFFLPAR